MSNTRFYGLTGGIGSGKSTAAQLFADLGVPILDLDKLGHTALAQNDIKAKLIQTFGKSILDGNEIHRGKLAKLAFASQENTQTLNQIMHPAIQQLEQMWRKKQTAPYAIIEASVLIESGGIKRMQGLIVVMCSQAIRERRLIARGTHNQEQIRAIIQRQCSDTERLKHADYILDNESDLQHLAAQVEVLHQKLSCTTENTRN